ncbi:MAG: FkbM family methyltransferase, partial [Nitrososphaerales archaeon]
PKPISEDVIVLEVGASYGKGAKYLSKLAGFVYAIEPDHNSYLHCKLLLRSKNVSVHEMAISNYDGEALLKGSSVARYCPSFFELEGIEFDIARRVKVRKLDSLSFPSTRTPTVLILDCEGSETLALEGAKNLLSKSIRYTLVETHLLANGSNTVNPVVKALSGFYNSVEIMETDNTYPSGWREKWVIGTKKATSRFGH